jgi:hypothetical protein
VRSVPSADAGQCCDANPPRFLTPACGGDAERLHRRRLADLAADLCQAYAEPLALRIGYAEHDWQLPVSPMGSAHLIYLGTERVRKPRSIISPSPCEIRSTPPAELMGDGLTQDIVQFHGNSAN